MAGIHIQGKSREKNEIIFSFYFKGATRYAYFMHRGAEGEPCQLGGSGGQSGHGCEGGYAGEVNIHRLSTAEQKRPLCSVEAIRGGTGNKGKNGRNGVRGAPGSKRMETNKTVSERQWFSCPACDQAFLSNNTLLTDRRRAHKERAKSAIFSYTPSST